MTRRNMCEVDVATVDTFHVAALLGLVVRRMKLKADFAAKLEGIFNAIDHTGNGISDLLVVHAMAGHRSKPTTCAIRQQQNQVQKILHQSRVHLSLVCFTCRPWQNHFVSSLHCFSIRECFKLG